MVSPNGHNCARIVEIIAPRIEGAMSGSVSDASATKGRAAASDPASDLDGREIERRIR